MLSSLPKHIFVLGTLCHWVGKKTYIAHSQFLFCFILFPTKDSVINYRPDTFLPLSLLTLKKLSFPPPPPFSLYLPIVLLFCGSIQHCVVITALKVFLNTFKNTLFSRQVEKEWHCSLLEWLREINNICETLTWTLKIAWTEVKKLRFPKALVRGLESPVLFLVQVSILNGLCKRKSLLMWKVFFFFLIPASLIKKKKKVLLV